jgi:1,4-dihydroxy-2-naphthoate polyprenyltransferase
VSHAATLQPPGRLRAWVLAARPATLWAGATPVLLGTSLAVADGHFALGPAVAALIGALLIQVGTNLVNDWADFRRGADGADRLGPARAVAQGWLTARQVAVGAAVSLTLAAAVGVYLVGVGGWPILALGLASLVCAVAYTAGPFPLGYHGLGDLFVLLFFGLGAVGGTYFVQAGALNAEVVAAGTALGLLATAILVVNNLRDRAGDARAGKRTLAVRFGARFTRLEYVLCVVGAYALAAGLAASGRWGWALTALSLPLAVAATRGVLRTDGAALNPLLGATARLELVFGLLAAVGVAL